VVPNIHDDEDPVSRWSLVVGVLFCVCGHDVHDHAGATVSCRFCEGCSSYLSAVRCG
jgi:hypothetical protein